MRLAILFSGGKDSTNALWYYLEQAWDVRCLLSLVPENPDSYMFQKPDDALLRAQAGRLGLPLLVGRTQGEPERELDDMRALLARAKEEHGIEGVAAGALASDYQHERVHRICEGLGLKAFAPLWHKEQGALLDEMIAAGFDVRMTRVAALGLGESWLGRRLTREDVARLRALHERFGVHVGGEGGEFETIVLDGPIFSAPVRIAFGKAMEGEHRGELVRIRIEGDMPSAMAPLERF